MEKRTFVKNAGVLLLIALMVFSSGAVVANTNNLDENITTSQNPQTQTITRDLIWDNVIGVYGALGGIIVATVRTEGIAFPADDFMLTSTKEVDSIFWQGGYFQCQLAQGQMDYHWDWRVIFWSDNSTGNHPGSEIYNQTIPDASITREHWYNYTHPTNGNTYWVANYSTQLPVTITFNANTKYWITIQGIQIPNSYPQACWSRHNNTVGGILLHEAEIMAAWWGFPTWTNISVLVTDHLPHDLNFQLFGGGVTDTIPPVTTCTLEGTMEGGVYITNVTATLTATDDNSGVDYTKYKVDSGAWTDYTAPFVVSADGAHTIYFYSVDNAGNIETEKTKTFTIQHPVDLSITIKGGIGVSAIIKNNGTTDMTDVSWSITLDGGFILIGKSKTGTIDIAAGEEVTIKSFVLGFGKTTITATAGDAEETATGTVILIFVIGVT